MATPAPGGSGTPITDFDRALDVRQAPGIDNDPAARQAALAGTDCTKPDPLHGRDLQALPLAACNDYGLVYLLAQTLLEGNDIDHAGYRHVAGDGWNLILTLTPEGLKNWTRFRATYHLDLALVVNGHVEVTAPFTNNLGNDIEVLCTEQQARDLATVINNH